MDVRNSTEANLQIKLNAVIYSSKTQLEVAKKFTARLSNSNPCSSLLETASRTT